MNLPDGARVWAALGIDRAWTIGDHLAAVQIDATNTVAWLNSDGSDSDRPKPIPRPSDLREAAEKAKRNRNRAERYLARKGVNIQ